MPNDRQPMKSLQPRFGFWFHAEMRRRERSSLGGRALKVKHMAVRVKWHVLRPLSAYNGVRVTTKQWNCLNLAHKMRVKRRAKNRTINSHFSRSRRRLWSPSSFHCELPRAQKSRSTLKKYRHSTVMENRSTQLQLLHLIYRQLSSRTINQGLDKCRQIKTKSSTRCESHAYNSAYRRGIMLAKKGLKVICAAIKCPAWRHQTSLTQLGGVKESSDTRAVHWTRRKVNRAQS